MKKYMENQLNDKFIQIKELKYDRTFEEALEAVNEGHMVHHVVDPDPSPLLYLSEMLNHISGVDTLGEDCMYGWAIIKKPTGKEKLIEHLEKDGKPVLCIVSDEPIGTSDFHDSRYLGLVLSVRGKRFMAQGGVFWSHAKPLTKEEVQSLVLEEK